MKTEPQAAPKVRTSPQIPWLGFGVTLVFLVLIAVVADNVTIRLSNDEKWVSHSQDVERVLGRLRGDIFAADSEQVLSLINAGEAHIEPYYGNSQRIPQDLDVLESLVTDNASQEEKLTALRDVVNRRTGIMRESLALKKTEPQSAPQLNDLTLTAAALSSQALAILQDLRDEEDRILKQRQSISQHTYGTVRFVLAIAFGVVVIILAGNFRRLLTELRDRTQADENVRRLSGRLLQVQDQERRKVAREIHDSIGQVFAAMKMNMSMLADSQAGDTSAERKAELFEELGKLLDQGITEARTLSHLLHPPLLDELGLASAAEWLVNGFSQRSGIQVTLQIPERLHRMPPPIELTLFRVLQESLTNIHRHSGSSTANIRIEQRPTAVSLVVRDFGSGISDDVVQKFRKSAAGLGVGLAGMRERVGEVDGRLDLYSDKPGTRLEVTLPLPLDGMPAPSLLPTPSQQSARPSTN